MPLCTSLFPDQYFRVLRLFAVFHYSHDEVWFFLTINKYAQRARTIVNRAIINEDPNAKIIRGLLHLF